MIHRTILLAGLWLGAPSLATAQIISGPIGRSSRPLAWTSLSIGWMSQRGLCDPDSNACWDFGSAPQWRATLEMPIGTGASFGVLGTMARTPLIYTGSGLIGTSCARCDATASISQIMGTLRLGGGNVGFHQVIDISAGATLFGNFRDAGGGRLGDGKTVSDASFVIGYGFGYGLSPRTSIMIVQDYGLVIHKRASGTSNNTAEQTNLRIGVHVGLGDAR